MNMLRKQIFLIVLIVLSFFVIRPLFVHGFFPMHDDTQVQRVYEMTKSLRAGMFPVRWVADLGYGYGYPLFNFYAPLAYYIGSLFMVIGFDALLATKLMIGLGAIFAGVSMYLLAKNIWNERSGFVAGLFYLFAPYHALDIYVRGDIAEMWAYAFIPLAFLGIWLCYKKNTYHGVLIGSLGYAGIILSHNLTAMMVSPFLLITAIMLAIIGYRQNEIFIVKNLAFLFTIGILLSCFYWLPVFAEMRYTNVLSQVGGGADYKDHFVCLPQLWDSPWLYGGSAKGCADGLSFRIGKLHVIGSIMALFSLSYFIRKRKDAFWIIFGSVIFLLVATTLLLPVSKPIWDAVPKMAFFQYPWRFLLLIAFFSSILLGSIIQFFEAFVKKNALRISLVAIMSLFALFLYVKLFVPQAYLEKTASDYTNAQFLKWNTSKISDEYMPKHFQKPRNVHDIVTEKIIRIQGDAVLEPEYAQVNNIIREVKTNEKTTILARIAPFPTWKSQLGVKPEDPAIIEAITQNGYQVSLPPGRDVLIRFRFEQTTVEEVANLMTFVGIVLLILAIIYLPKNERKTAKTP